MREREAPRSGLEDERARVLLPEPPDPWMRGFGAGFALGVAVFLGVAWLAFHFRVICYSALGCP